MLLWNINYFELKAFEKQQMQERSTDLPFSERRRWNPLWKVSSMYQEERNILITKDEELRPREIFENKPC